MTKRKWIAPKVVVIKAGSAENNPTGSANDGGTGTNPKRIS